MSFAIRRATVIGSGVIGSGWASVFLSRAGGGGTATGPGAPTSTVIYDPDPQVATKLKSYLAAAAPTLAHLGRPLPHNGDIDALVAEKHLSFTNDLAEAVDGTDVVQESILENPSLKQDMWATVEAAAPSEALLLSSSSAIVASVQNQKMRNPGRLVIGHPFNPTYLIPLVEVVPTPQTPPELTRRIRDMYQQALGKSPVVLEKEFPGFVVNRLQSLIFLESMALLNDGVINVKDLDMALSASLGIRWAAQAPLVGLKLGARGDTERMVKGVLKPVTDNVRNSLHWPTFDDALQDRLIRSIDAAYGDKERVAELTRERDENQIGIIKTLSRK